MAEILESPWLELFLKKVIALVEIIPENSGRYHNG
jgi:hypothetical protein